MFNLSDLSLLVPALIAGALVLLTHVPLGQRVLARNIVFVDLAIAQVAALGMMTAQLLHIQGAWGQVVALLFAIVGALIFSFSEKKWPAQQEAHIGVAFVLAATAAMILLAGDPHAGEAMNDVLAGQILWINLNQLIYPAVLTLAILAVYYVKPLWLERWFYVFFALAVTQSVQLVGVYLVFASLILPALAMHNSINSRAKFVWGFTIGLLGYASGLALSYLFDLPAGPLIVWMMAVLALLARSLKGCRVTH